MEDGRGGMMEAARPRLSPRKRFLRLDEGLK